MFSSHSFLLNLIIDILYIVTGWQSLIMTYNRFLSIFMKSYSINLIPDTFIPIIGSKFLGDLFGFLVIIRSYRSVLFFVSLLGQNTRN